VERRRTGTQDHGQLKRSRGPDLLNRGFNVGSEVSDADQEFRIDLFARPLAAQAHLTHTGRT
jgi:hypothetical protein